MPSERSIVHVEFSAGFRPGGRPTQLVAVLFPVFRHRSDLFYSFQIWCGSWTVFAHR